jgi:RNA polymerase sigma-70 factor (ECF subfamily)
MSDLGHPDRDAGVHQADRDLARRVVGGCPSADAELHARFAGRVSGLVRRLLGGRDREHEDLVQSAFLQIVISLRGYDGGCSLVTWVTRVVMNTAYKAIRRRKRDRVELDETRTYDAPAREVDPTVALMVREALAVVTTSKREAVLLHDLLGHDLSEIAALRGISAAAAQSQIHRARRAMRDALVR